MGTHRKVVLSFQILGKSKTISKLKVLKITPPPLGTSLVVQWFRILLLSEIRKSHEMEKKSLEDLLYEKQESLEKQNQLSEE